MFFVGCHRGYTADVVGYIGYRRLIGAASDIHGVFQLLNQATECEERSRQETWRSLRVLFDACVRSSAYRRNLWLRNLEFKNREVLTFD